MPGGGRGRSAVCLLGTVDEPKIRFVTLVEQVRIGGDDDQPDGLAQVLASGVELVD
jgi:hypothetical protein